MKTSHSLLAIIIVSLIFSVSTLAQHDKVSSDPVSAALFKIASSDFNKGDYFHAIVNYQVLLDREKEEPTLEKVYWYVLIDNLGMANGISGDLDQAEEVFNYGISKDSTYPMFYYNMACTFAERKDMDKAISWLVTAYKYKDNMIAGEPFPDPMLDESFKRFSKKERFVETIKKLKQNNLAP